jgi:hypothetical protein
MLILKNLVNPVYHYLRLPRINRSFFTLASVYGSVEFSNTA